MQEFYIVMRRIGRAVVDGAGSSSYAGRFFESWDAVTPSYEINKWLVRLSANWKDKFSVLSPKFIA